MLDIPQYDGIPPQLLEGFTLKEQAQIRLAYSVMMFCHEGQQRDSGEPYSTHPIAVALIVAELIHDAAAVIAALLHDVVEDCKHKISLDELDKLFSWESATIIRAVSHNKEGGQSKKEFILQIFLFTRILWTVLIVKMADCLHNLLTLNGIKNPARRRKFVNETVNEFLPMCEQCLLYLPFQALAPFNTLRSRIRLQLLQRQAELDPEQLTLRLATT